MKLFRPKEDPVEPDTGVHDEQTKAMLFDGASISQLAALFGSDNRTIAKKIQGLSACGRRKGHPIYSVKDAAAFLVTPNIDIEAAIRKMRPEDLPAALQREYWSAQRARLAFEEDQGDLWRTQDVIEHFAKVFKTLRTVLVLLPDTVERDAIMTDRQKSVVQTLIDTALKDLHKTLVQEFEHEPDRVFNSPEAGTAPEGADPEEPERAEEERDPAEDL